MPHPRILALPFLVATLGIAAGAPAGGRTQRTVPMRLTEYRIEMPDSVQQGEVVFAVTNAGREDHQISVRGHRAMRMTRVLKPGETVTFPMRLLAGEYTAYCNVRERGGNHRRLGMERTLRVHW